MIEVRQGGAAGFGADQNREADVFGWLGWADEGGAMDWRTFAAEKWLYSGVP